LARTPRTAPRPQPTRTGTNRRSTRPPRQPRRSPVDLQVFSVSRAIAYTPSGREVCISIANPGVSATVLSAKFADVLRVSFSDSVAPSPFPFDRLFDTGHARAIVEFVARWADVDRIVVHCVGGVSRSPAVALAIAELLGQPTDALERRFPMWNTWVRQELVKAGRAFARIRPRRRVRDRA
jgi:hypothetical protein